MLSSLKYLKELKKFKKKNLKKKNASISEHSEDTNTTII